MSKSLAELLIPGRETSALAVFRGDQLLGWSEWVAWEKRRKYPGVELCVVSRLQLEQAAMRYVLGGSGMQALITGCEVRLMGNRVPGTAQIVSGGWARDEMQRLGINDFAVVISGFDTTGMLHSYLPWAVEALKKLRGGPHV